MLWSDYKFTILKITCEFLKPRYLVIFTYTVIEFSLNVSIAVKINVCNFFNIILDC